MKIKCQIVWSSFNLFNLTIAVPFGCYMLQTLVKISFFTTYIHRQSPITEGIYTTLQKQISNSIWSVQKVKLGSVLGSPNILLLVLDRTNPTLYKWFSYCFIWFWVLAVSYSFFFYLLPTLAILFLAKSWNLTTFSSQLKLFNFYFFCYIFTNSCNRGCKSPKVRSA